VGYRNLFDSLKGLRSIGNVMNCMKNVGAEIPGATGVADSDDNVFKDDEALFMFESLPLDLLGTNSSFTILTPITIH
jgi:hypothetical protein